MTALAAGTKTLEALRAIRDLDKAYDAAEWKGKLAELMSDVADMRIALIDANEQIRTLQKEKEDLEKLTSFKAEKTVYSNGFYYEIFDDGTISALPFCQRCMVDGKYIRITYTPMIDYASFCPGCNTSYSTTAVTYSP